MAVQGSVVVTGGAGFVGSHVVVELLEQGYDVMVIDRLDDVKLECIRKIEQLTGKTLHPYNLDLNDTPKLRSVFCENTISCVIHLAATKYHGESIRSPLKYYRNNIVGLTNLLMVMEEFGVHRMVYASTVAVYGTAPKCLPFVETIKVGENLKDTYSKTKYFCEEMLKDLCVAKKEWSVVILRFFNPVGAHKSGLIGEHLIEKPPNLMPNIARTAMDLQEEFIIFGGKYDTEDGTGVRDYTHVVDIAKGHVAALNNMKDGTGTKIYNLGTGSPHSSLQMMKAFEKASGKSIPYKIVAPRSYDTPSSWADVSLAREELGWTATLNIADMCEDAWRWYSNNPRGFLSKE